MVAEAVDRTSVRTSDFDEVVATMRATFGGVDLVRDDEPACGLRMRSVRTEHLTSARWSLTGVDGGSRGVHQQEGAYLTGVLLGGTARMRTRWEEVDLTRPFLYPEPAEVEQHHPDAANLGVSREVVQARARSITGIDDFDLRFTGTAPIDARMDRIWRDTIAYTARTTAAFAELPETAIAQAELLDLVASLLLRTFPNSTLDAVNRRDVTGPRGAALRRALRFMDDNLGLPITIADVAQAARLSPRGLYAAFQRDLGTTPMNHLRDARLTAARDDLRAADPESVTVAAIAARWGFVDVAAFTERYLARCGELPDTTLLR